MATVVDTIHSCFISKTKCRFNASLTQAQNNSIATRPNRTSVLHSFSQASTQNTWRAPGWFFLVWLWCGGHTEVGRCLARVFTERSEVPLVTLNLCVMRRYNLGEDDLVPHHPPLFLRRATARLK